MDKELNLFLNPKPGMQIIGMSENARVFIIQCTRCGELQRIEAEQVKNVSCCAQD